ncbi:hypothetical protein BDV95DRAFT_572627 [Massariosphaeria phaeospora]|uniref:Uncharacterized protein n=1 Tax=Massariosphaeria phaeospora TaxID=100035 RepID=A0A7C8I624_9PLEO|nr:hypothetical protein BDV95DRAFT_572627 [Massariosphaeria phaeospora]
MGNLNGIRTAWLIAPPMLLLLPLSIILVILERIPHTLLLAQAVRNWRTGDRTLSLSSTPTDSPSSSPSTDIILHINYAPALAILGVGAAAYTISVLSICAIWELRRQEGAAAHQRKWAWVTLVLNLAVGAASAAVLAWASVLQSGEDKWRGYEDVGKAGERRFTTETWVCQIKQLDPQQDWAGPACGLAKATRFTLIPLALSSALVIACTWILVNDRGGVKWLFGSKGRYGAFPDAFELAPPGQHVMPMAPQYLQMPMAPQYQMPMAPQQQYPSHGQLVYAQPQQFGMVPPPQLVPAQPQHQQQLSPGGQKQRVVFG